MPSCAPPASGRGSPLPWCSSAGSAASRVSVGASMAGILLVSWATTVSCRRRSSVRASRSASSCSRRYRIWSCSEAMSSDWSPGTLMLGVWFAPDVPSPNRTNTVPLSFVVGRVPRLIRLRTAPSVMPNAAAAWATVRRSWFACGSPVLPSPTREILEHQDQGRKPLEAILVRLVGIHRGFIATRYRRGYPAAAIDPLQSESCPIRPPGSSRTNPAPGCAKKNPRPVRPEVIDGRFGSLPDADHLLDLLG